MFHLLWGQYRHIENENRFFFLIRLGTRSNGAVERSGGERGRGDSVGNTAASKIDENPVKLYIICMYIYKRVLQWRCGGRIVLYYGVSARLKTHILLLCYCVLCVVCFKPVQAHRKRGINGGHWLHNVFIQVLMQWDKEKDDWVILVFMEAFSSISLSWM